MPASAVSATARKSSWNASGSPWKLPPETISSSSTSGLSVAAVQLDGEDPPRLRQRIAHRAVHLRRAAQRIGILHAPAGDVRLPDLAAFQQSAQAARRSAPGRDADAPAWMRGSKARGVPRKASRVMAQITSAESASTSAAASSRQPDRQHGLRAIDQRDAFLGAQRDRLHTARGAGLRRPG